MNTKFEKEHQMITMNEDLRVQALIKKYGLKKFIKKYGEAYKKNSVEGIPNSFNTFQKNMKLYELQGLLNFESKTFFDKVKELKQETIIFNIDNNKVDENVSLSQVIIPFGNLFIGSNILFEMDDELYSCEGFFVIEKENLLDIGYFWSKRIGDGYGFNRFIINKDNLINPKFDETKVNFFNETSEERWSRDKIIIQKFWILFKNILQNIAKKEYTTYQKWKPSGLITKEIIYSHDVSTHIRHFWKDSGRFKIPLMKQEKWESLGYLTRELIYHNGNIERDVPYIIIGSFIVGKDKLRKKENRTIEILQGKVWRNEQRLLEIVRELYPFEFIKRHDRKAVKPLELDIYIKNLNLAFEYDGKQHFDKKLCEEVFKSDFKELQKRDRKKDIKCRDKGIYLIRVKFDEKLNKANIKRKIKQRLK